MARRAARKDNNHNPIKKRLEGIGCLTWDCSGCGAGFPDLFVFDPVSGMVWLVEIKSKTGKLTEREVPFHDLFEDCPNVVIWRSSDEAQRAVEVARGVTFD